MHCRSGCCTADILESVGITFDDLFPKRQAKLKLPDSVVKDEAANVIASTQVKADSHPQTVTTVLDTSGKSIIYIRKDPLPWLDYKTSGSVGIYGGITNDGMAGLLRAEQDLIAIKSLVLGVNATVIQPTSGTDTTGFVGIGGKINW